METVESKAALRAVLAPLAAHRRRIGLVPTLGALHAGHLAHVDALRQRVDVVVMSIFVNPLQFGPDEDFERYPRDIEHDAEKAKDGGVDVLCVPSRETMYPAGAETVVQVPGLAARLEGVSRPTHFLGVATVVAKLLNLVRPDVASFGQKDLQQLLVVRRMVEDLQMPVEILAVPTVRDPDGLALSSRNAYLSTDDRKAAPVLYQALRAGLAALAAGTRKPSAIEETMAAVLEREPRAALEYAVARRLPDLGEGDRLFGPVALLVAARVGGARLIDNVVVEVGSGTVSEMLP